MTVVEEQLVAPASNSVLYLSRRSDLWLVKVPRYPIYGAGGMKRGEAQGEMLQFREGRLDVPLTGKMELADGRKVDVGPIHEWLAEHKLLGDVEGGFWKVDPVAPPVSQEEMRQLMQASLALDAETLTKVVEQERAGWNRSEIIEEAESALESIAAMRAQAEAEAAAAVAEEPPKSKPGPKPKGAQD